MPHDWQGVQFSDFCDVTRGGSPRPIHDYIAPVGIPWVKIADVARSGTRFITETNEFIRPEGESKSRRVFPGDLILSNSATPGIPMFMGIEACIHDGWMLLRNLRGVDKLFCFYLLQHESANLIQQGNGSVFVNLKTDILKTHRVSIPPIDEQRAIADVLGALDDKIEQNRRTAWALERLARAIFRAWFVDFEPVKAKVEGATAFPSIPEPVFDALPTRFVDSAIGPVPEGWEVKPITQIATFLNGLALQKYPPRNDGTDLAVIKIAQLRKGSTDGADASNDSIDEKYKIRDGDLLFSWSGTLDAAFWFGGPGALNQHLFKVTSADYPQWLAFEWIHQHMPEFRLIAASKATTMGHIKRGHLSQALVAVPPPELLEPSDELLSPLFELFATMQLESRKLAEMRDYLLPQLLSGKVRVKDIEQTLETTA